MSNVAELLIASVTPQNLERGDLWFSENAGAIKKARFSNPWWRDNAAFIEKDLALSPPALARKLLDWGYERTQTVLGKGLFAVRGGVIEAWPINLPKPYLIEFAGNSIALIRIRPEAEEKIKPRLPARSLDKLPAGSFVVHADHGIGVYRGLTQTLLQTQTNTGTFFVVEYAPPAPGREPDRLYVPIDKKARLTPYLGFEIPRIHRLGGSVWLKTKRRVKEDAEKIARELLVLYAKRHEIKRPPHPGDKVIEEEVRVSFPYAETEDQLRAEEEILADLSSAHPMDRVLCGDVGFGKTEIALRAALRVVTSGKQVAILAPTTILASQHEKTFQERLSNLPVETRMLSRLTPKEKREEILRKLKEGKIDCLIGTHRLLSSDIVFKDLGLVIIDEEQRFGVKQKERFKELRTEVDILSLSATPIPRTLSLALAKLRDLSLISSPPPERLPIATLVLPYSGKTIREAIDFELRRRGQIYFLHNRIETIGQVREKLRSLKLNRRLRIEVIHGRMREKDMIRAMDKFRNKEADLLLATTIIENGLDISSANTLIVDEATRLGLAEAHQLRGRIGRGGTRGFSYFFYKPRHLTEKAGERLEALQEYAQLGDGYQIALRDLEIRGAGNILGREQSGAINKVGLNLYCQILAEAVEDLRQD